MKRILTALVLGFSLLFASGGVVYSQDFNKGGEAYKKGDYATAFREWSELAEQGDAEVQFILGWMYDSGKGVLQDYKEAVKWYRKSAEQGNAEAQRHLGLMYGSGKGVLLDNKEAVKWFRKSAEQGDVSAQFGLGWMYANFLQDDIYTHMWWNIAASNGNADAVKARDIVEKRMTTEQLAEAQKLARECVKKNYKGC